jgi:hypothetical protein
MGALRNGQAHTVCTLLAVAKEAILLLRLPARGSFWGRLFSKRCGWSLKILASILLAFFDRKKEEGLGDLASGKIAISTGIKGGV